MERDEEKLNALTEMLEDINDRLSKLVEDDEIDPQQRTKIIRYFRKVMEKLIVKYDNVTKGVDKTMGGFLIMTEEEEAEMRAEMRGRELGEEIGKEIGKELGEELRLIRMVCKKMKHGYKIEEIADALEEDIPTITEIYNAALMVEPQYDENAIYEHIS